MGVPGIGGFNALTRNGSAGVKTGRWPWEESGPNPPLWPVEAIRDYLENDFANRGLVTQATARDGIASLADAHFLLQLARFAIMRDMANPLVGKRCAYVVQSGAHAQVTTALKNLGVFPLGRAPAETEDDSEQPGANGHAGLVPTFAPPSA